MSNTNPFAIVVLVLVATVMTFVALARLPQTIIDPRILGTWQSDADKTIAEMLELRPLTEQQIDKLQELFGKLRVSYRPDGTVTSDFQNFVDTERYQILRRDSESIVLRVIHTRGTKSQELDVHLDPVYRIEFDGPHAYWQRHADDPSREYFRRVQ